MAAVVTMADNDNNGAGATGGADNPRLTDLAKNAGAPGVDEPKRGRGRPAGSTKTAGPVAPVAPVIPAVLWNPGNVGALVRLPFAGVAMLTDIKDLELKPEEEPLIIPAAVEVFNQFAPLAAAKWAGVIAFGAGAIAIGSAKWSIYKTESAKRAEAAKKLPEEKK